MPPKKKIKVKATSTEDGLPGISLASGSIQSDEQATDRGIAMSLGYGRVNAVFDKKRARYRQTVTYESSQPFDLTTATVKDGIFKGRQIVLIEPHAPDTTPFCFLDLPAEIRNMIYVYAFCGPPENVRIIFSGKRKRVQSWNPHSGRGDLPDLNILTTCRQIHDEAASIFYGSMQFAIRCNHITDFLSSLTVHLKYIRKVTIEFKGRSLKPALLLLTRVKHLEVLRVEDRTSSNYPASYFATVFKQFLSNLQEKVNDREAVCQKVAFVNRPTYRYWGSQEDRGFTHDQFKQEVFRYLIDEPEPQPEETFTPASDTEEVLVRRDTGRPKRSVITKKAISYAEDN